MKIRMETVGEKIKRKKKKKKNQSGDTNEIL